MTISTYIKSFGSNLTRELVQSFLSVLVFRLANLVLAFISSVILARTLGPDGYGMYSFTMSLVISLSLVAYLGLPELIVRETARYEIEKEWGFILGLARDARIIALIISALLVIVVYVFFGDSAVRPEKFGLLVLALPLVIILPQLHLVLATLRGMKKAVLASLPIMLVQPLVFFSFLLGLLLLGELDSRAAITVQILSFGAAVFVGLAIFLRLKTKRFLAPVHIYDRSQWYRSLPSFSGIALVSYVNVELINLLLGFLVPSAQVGYFRAATNLALVVALPITLLDRIIAPYITQLYFSQKTEQLERLTQATSLAALLASIVPGIFLVIFGRDIIELVYGPGYEQAFGPLVVLVTGYLGINLVGLSMRLLMSTEYQSDAFRVSLAGAIVTVIVCTLAIPPLGALGAAIALAWGKFLRASLFVYVARKRLGIKTSLVY